MTHGILLPNNTWQLPLCSDIFLKRVVSILLLYFLQSGIVSGVSIIHRTLICTHKCETRMTASVLKQDPNA